ncbi:hypothetical protein F4779DRAFT_577340 [Xylariaceae sp. FL0662B]|nr:hypothetical protein F4779DRAFT_577340 [Xylariaceae sp. FL0662B]
MLVGFFFLLCPSQRRHAAHLLGTNQVSVSPNNPNLCPSNASYVAGQSPKSARFIMRSAKVRRSYSSRTKQALPAGANSCFCNKTVPRRYP